ncbi:Acetyltransferase (isoleucine patch superfamily) [Bifidobacterium actinocoloniiforme DSM 22766]|uniref:Acetyltransferase (Isoleucine patch superfamily) n=1 Tax=Bifidobacterium actinocoloniiforme DSM 22766 TaxID=1437605 RepID=A0A086Z269_9BIFI|nr:sugar O-acetyltransferase [Bifidobacterium actinocoloniiforme]AKV55964.1 acetyltransferase [Bifidobacterium actinocoloniiforme DSM 22766]KFI40619.1 Acetyltransferase (isoleucine patch superfamily) [Bifidobacterium actinocoloniiforme DSM 22766]
MAADTMNQANQRDARGERERMLAGEPYNAADPGLSAMRAKAHELCRRYNALSEAASQEREAIMKELVGGIGADSEILGPVFFDYGVFTTIGERVFANFNFSVLDVCPVTIGSNVMFGPNVSLMTPLHPLCWEDRNLREAESGELFDYEYGAPITIGSNCWLAANVTVTGGVTIGEGSVIGAGSVVTHDIPPHSLAYGTPCRVARQLTEADRMALPTRFPERS